MKPSKLFAICFVLFTISCTKNQLPDVAQPQLELSDGTYALFSPDEAQIIVASGGLAGRDLIPSLTIWDIQSGVIVYQSDSETLSISDADYNADNSALLTMSLQPELTIWDTNTWEVTNRLDIADGFPCDFSHHPTMNVIAVAECSGSGGAIKVQKEGSYSNLSPLVTWTKPYSSQVALSPDGNFLATAIGEEDKTRLGIWSTASWEELYELQVDDGGLSKLAWSVNTEELAITTITTITIWNMASNNVREIDNTDNFKSIIFHPKENLLLAGGDTSVAFWELDELKIVEEINIENVNSIDVNSAGDQIVVTSNDGTLVWNIDYLLTD